MLQQRKNNIPLYGQRMSKSAPCSPVKPTIAKKAPARADSFHVIHKVPPGDTPYVKAKHVQLVDKDPDRAIALFWAAINAGDRVDSALKDMAVVMKQQNRPEEAIEAIKSLRNRCSDQAQESLDNVLLDLYKRCGRLDDQIALLKHKLNLINQGIAFNGKRTKTARSQGKKFQVSIEQEATRLLGNLGWAYMQQNNYIAAEVVYKKALSIEPDNNKMCNLGICLMKQGRITEAKAMLQCVKPASADGPWGQESHLKSYERAQEMLKELESQEYVCLNFSKEKPESESTTIDRLQSSLWQPQLCSRQPPSKRDQQNKNLVLESMVGNAVSTAFLATAGFGPMQHTSEQEELVPKVPKSSHFPKFSNNSWEENREESFADENVNVNIPVLPRPPLFVGASSEMQSHAGTLRQKLEQVACNGMFKPTFSPPNSNNHNLNSAVPPFFSRSSNPKQGTEDRMPLTLDRNNDQKTMMPFQNQSRIFGKNGTTKNNLREFPTNKNSRPPRRSLSFECVHEGSRFDLFQTQFQSAQNNNNLTKANSISLPLQKKADPWPDNQEFEETILTALCYSNPSSHEEKIHKRLRVFQEMTASPRA